MVETTNTLGRRLSDKPRHFAAFCQPVMGGDVKLTLAAGASLLLQNDNLRASTEDLVAQAKMVCTPLCGSINSRFMALAVLRGAR